MPNNEQLVARPTATLEHKQIESPQDILHYGNNALAILATTVETIKALYNDPGTNMPKRIERMEAAIGHLTDIVRDSAAFAEKHAAEVLAAERARVTKEILALQTPGPTESLAAASWNRALFQARKIVEQNNE